MSGRLPRGTLAVLRRLLPASDREFVIGDLVEEYQQRAARTSRAHAAWWLRRQALTTMVRRWMAAAERARPASGQDRPGRHLMERLIQDVRYAWRQIRSSPGLAATIVVTFALAIGANTAIYSVVHAVLIRPLPFSAPERVVVIRADVEGYTGVGVLSAPELIDLRERATGSFEGFAGVWGTSGAIAGDRPEHIPYAWVTGNALPLLGIDPILGRALRPEDDVPGAERVVLIGEELWRRRFSADPGVVGQAVTIDDQSYTVVGVVPSGVQVPRGAFALELRHYDAWMPQTFWENRGQRWLGIIGRLRPDATLAQAREELAAVASALVAEHAEYDAQAFRLTAMPVHGDLVSGVQPALVALAGAVAFVLLIACTNVAALLLVRGRGRMQEFAVHRALGAGGGLLARQLLVESLVLSIAGGAAGLVVAWWCLGLVDLLSPANLPRLDEVRIDRVVLAVTFGLTLATGVLAGLAPMLQASRVEPGAALKSDRRTMAGSGGRARGALVVVQLALSLLLLVGAGLMTRSLVAMNQVDPGFVSSGIISVKVPIAFQTHQSGAERWQFYREFTERVRAIPGVEEAGAISLLPLAGGVMTGPFAWDPASDETWGQRAADYRTVTPGYFETVRTTLVAGRYFDDSDAAASAHVVVIDEALAEQAWPGEDPIGRQLKFMINPGGNQMTPGWGEVIGMVRHVRLSDLRADGAAQLYRPFWIDNPTTMTLAARVASDPIAIVPELRTVAQELGAGRPLHTVSLFDDFVAAATSDLRFVMTLLMGFAAVAVLLTAVGLYGVVAYGVSSRSREIGIRLALGAEPRAVRRMVLGQGGVITGLGLTGGLVAAPFAARALGSIVFGVGVWDPATYVAAAAVFAVVTLVACWVPARRASRVDPASIMRAS